MVETLAPRGKLDLAAVAQLHRDLHAVAEHDVVLDLTDVTQIGALCLQSCVAAARRAHVAGTSFKLAGVSPQVAEHITAMGFNSQNFAGDSDDT
ncbi:MAG: STAS domain-containing protein [Pseudomonadota bacterium]